MQRVIGWACWISAVIGLAVAISALFGGVSPAIAIAGHFAFYAALGGWILSIAGRLLHAGRAAYAALAVALVNSLIVAQSAMGVSRPEPGAETAKLLLFNIRWSNERLDDVVALVSAQQPDVVVLSEVYAKNRPGLRALDAQYPYRIECWQSWPCDTLILSRKPLRDPFVATRWQDVEIGFARVEFEIGACPVTLFTAHLNRPWPYHSLRSAAAQFKQADALAHAVREWPGAKIVAGDMNATTRSPVVRALASAADGRALSGSSGTWPNFLPGLLKLPIDHIVVSERQIKASRDVLGPTGSDHSPVLATLSADCGR
jgi:endonuclease/exonuclease/phosphatase (EEP) superfamily protein YafD